MHCPIIASQQKQTIRGAISDTVIGWNQQSFCSGRTPNKYCPNTVVKKLTVLKSDCRTN